MTTEPDQGGLIGGLCGLSTDAYSQRTRRRLDEIDKLEQIDRGLKARVDDGQHVADDLDSRVKRLRQRVSVLGRRVAEQSSSNVQARANLAAVEQEVENLRTQLVALIAEDRRHAQADEAVAAGRRKAREEQALAKAHQNTIALQALNAEIDQIDQRARERAAQ